MKTHDGDGKKQKDVKVDEALPAHIHPGVPIEARGWKEIREVIFQDRVRHKWTMKRILLRLGILTYDGKAPVVNVQAYEIASLQRHVKGKGK